jgi:hypothetical protein
MKAYKLSDLPKCEAGEFYRFPRTMLEAFPTHHKHDLYVEYAPMSPGDKWVTAACTVAAIVLMAFNLKGWL